MSLCVYDTGEVVVRVPLHATHKQIESFIEAHTEWIERALEKAKEKQKNAVVLTPEEIDHLKDLARKDLAERVKSWSCIMGVAPTKLTIRNQKTRWGSCSSKGTLSLNCQLMLCPEELRDYIVVHELSHLKHFNHSAAFWACVESYLPDARERKRALKKYSLSTTADKEQGVPHE